MFEICDIRSLKEISDVDQTKSQKLNQVLAKLQKRPPVGDPW